VQLDLPVRGDPLDTCEAYYQHDNMRALKMSQERLAGSNGKAPEIELRWRKRDSGGTL